MHLQCKDAYRDTLTHKKRDTNWYADKYREADPYVDAYEYRDTAPYTEA